MSIIDWSLARTRTVMLIFTLLIVAGLSSFITIPKESNPDVTIPMVYVSVRHEGISPEDGDRILFLPLFKEIRSLDGLKDTTSTATEGHLSVQLEFHTDVDIEEALTDVREAVDRAKAEFPRDTDEPVVKEINVSTMAPVLVLGLAGNVDERILFKVARDLKDKLEGIQGVLEAKIAGDREEVAEIIVDPLLMDSYNLDQANLFNLVSRNNQLVAAGQMDTGSGRFALKVPGLIENAQDILDMPVKVDGDQVVHFKDIAFGQRTFKDPRSKARFNGKPAVAIEITKRIGSNIIETIQEAKDLVKKEQSSWPEGIEVTFNQDESRMIREMLSDLGNNVLFATLLVVVVIVSTLGPRTSFLVSLAIPGSFLMGILALDLMGNTLNMVVLFALILSVGMLVDGAIVVTEFADRRMSEGDPPRMAYAKASKRMAWPIIASTLTTLAVFFPLLFWPGIMGEFMKYLPLTVLVTLSASLLMALIIVPTVGGLMGKPGQYSPTQQANIHAAETGNFNQLTGFSRKYADLMTKLLQKPLWVLGAALLILFGSFKFYGSFGHGTEFFPDVDSDIVFVDIRARGNLSLEERDEIVREAEFRMRGMNEVKVFYAKTVVKADGNSPPDQVGRIQMELVNWQHRRKADAILDDVRERLSDIPGIQIETMKAQGGPSSGADVQLEITSKYMPLLKEVVTRTTEQLAESDQLKDVRNNMPLEGIEWQLKVDRAEASRFGTDIATVGSLFQMISNGLRVGEYRPDDADDEVEIRLRYPVDWRNLDQINAIKVPVKGELVPVTNFVKRVPGQLAGDVARVDGELRYLITANVAEGVNQNAAIGAIAEELSKANFPEAISWRFRGDAEEQMETGIFLMTAFFAAIFSMMVILVTQFNSFYQTALVMSAIVLSIVGVLVGLLLRQEPFGIVMSGVGVIALSGIVVNNNIVLIDTYKRLRESGVAAIEAALAAGVQRMRPVLLTTITTVLGLVPMVFQLNINFVERMFSIGAPSSQWWVQLSTAIAGGLVFATLLTLILTPCMLVAGDKGWLTYLLKPKAIRNRLPERLAKRLEQLPD